MDGLLAHARRALWLHVRAPGFVVMSALVVGLGIATMTVVFSLAYSLFLRPLAGVAVPRDVVEIAARSPDGMGFNTFSYPAYETLRRMPGVFDGLAAHGIAGMGLTRDGYAKQVWGVVVTPNYFQVLGVRAGLGRHFAAAEPDPRVVVLSQRLWSREFGSDRSIVGRTIELNGEAFTVVGVAPRGFAGTMRGFGPELWVPIAAHGGEGARGSRSLADPSASWLQIVGRLQRGVPATLAAEKLTRAAGSDPSDTGLPGGSVITLQTAGRLSGGARTGLAGFAAILMIAAGGLLLAAVANVSGMLLARSSARTREIAIRLAIGAPRAQLLRQFVVEGVLLGAAGALAGVLMSVGVLHWLNRVRPPIDVPLALDLRLDPLVLGLSCGVAAAVALVFTFIPAREAWRTDVMTVLRNGSQTAARGDTRMRVRFVTLQVISTVSLLAVAGTFAGAVRKGLSLDPGMQAENVVVASINMEPRALSPDAGWAVQEQLLTRIRAVPDVDAAGLTTSVPLGQTTSRAAVSRADGGAGSGGLPVGFARVSGGYFRALRIPILRGREFGPSDRGGSPRVALVNEALARQLWNGDDAVGRSIRLGADSYEVVGVARNGKYGSASETPQPFVYFSLAQEYAPEVALVAKLKSSPVAALAALPRFIREVDPGIPVADVKTLDAHIALNVLPQRIIALLTAALGVVGLLLAAMGLYGTISYTVGMRTREFGIRMALGETGRSVRQSVVKASLSIAAKGIVIGSVLAAGAMYLVQRLSFGFGAGELLVLATAAAVVLLAATAASYLPALRATRADPVAALRAE